MAEIKEFLNPKSILTPGPGWRNHNDDCQQPLDAVRTTTEMDSAFSQFPFWRYCVFSENHADLAAAHFLPFELANHFFDGSWSQYRVGNTVASGESSRETAAYLDSNPGSFFDSWLSPAWAQPDDRAERLDQEIEMLEKRSQALREERETMMEEAERIHHPTGIGCLNLRGGYRQKQSGKRSQGRNQRRDPSHPRSLRRRN